MTDVLYSLLSKVPADADRVIVIYPNGKKTALASIGMSNEQIAELLYQMADEIVDKNIPPRDWRERIKHS